MCHLHGFHGNNRIIFIADDSCFDQRRLDFDQNFFAERLIKKFPIKCCKKTTLNDF